MSRDLYIEGNNVTPVVKALSNPVRIKILSLLSGADMNIQTLASHLKLSKTAVLTHINLLEEAGFIQSRYLPGSVGNQRVCHKIYDRLIFNFVPGHTTKDEETYYEREVPIGNYFDFEAWAPCGMATRNSIIQKWDDPTVFLDVGRLNSTLVWTAFGFLEYKIPLDPHFVDKRVSCVEIELEVSAHHMIRTHPALSIPSYANLEDITDELSDITLWINGHEIGTQTIAAGNDRDKATYTPTWWRSLPVHGFPLRLRLDGQGGYINDCKTSTSTFDEVIHANFLRFRIGIKRDAGHKGGLMVFGKEFGAHCHDLIVRTFIE